MVQSASTIRSPESTRGGDRLISSTPIQSSFLTYAKKPTNARRRIVPRTPGDAIDDDKDNSRTSHRKRIVKTVLQIYLHNIFNNTFVIAPA